MRFESSGMEDFDTWRERQRDEAHRRRQKRLLGPDLDRPLDYRLVVSDDAGNTYRIFRRSRDKDFLVEIGQLSFDPQGLRWSVLDSFGNHVAISAIHQNLLDFVRSMNPPQEELE